MRQLQKIFLERLEIYPKSNKVYYFFALSVILIMCYYAYETGPVVHTGYVYDTILILDGAVRTHQGQVQGIDFHSLQGPLFFQIISAFMHTAKGLTASIVSANIFMTIFLSAISFLVFIPRTSCIVPIGIAFSASLFCLGSYALGAEPRIGYAMLYNRYCYAMLFIIVAETVFPSNKKYYNEILGAVVVGVLLTLLFFIKYTYFFVGLAFLAHKVITRKASYSYIMSFILSFFIFNVLIMMLFRFNFYQIILDYLVPYRVGALTKRGTHYGFQKIKPHIQSIVMAIGMFFVYLKVVKKCCIKQKIADFSLVGLLFVSAIFLTFTNFGKTDMPLLVILSIVLLELTIVQCKKMECPSIALLCMAVCFVSLSSTFVIHNIWSLGAARGGKERFLSGVEFARKLNRNDLLSFMMLDSVPLDDLLMVSNVGIPNAPSIALMNDGLQLVKTYTNKEDSIGAFAAANFLNIGLDRASPRKSILFWDLGMTFDKKVFPNPTDEFGALRYIMVPKNTDYHSSGTMLEVYGDYLKKNFVYFAESKYWTLFKRQESY